MGAVSESKYLVTGSWWDVPHISDEAKQQLLQTTPPYLRDARSKGIPSLGSGAIYPIPVEQITVEPFAIPAHWKRAYGMDVGWKTTAALWGAKDPESNTLYVYTEHYRHETMPVVHAEAIKARGLWIPGTIDPAAHGRSQQDGSQLFATYTGMGLNLVNAENGVEAGLYEVWQALELGKLKLFKTLQKTLSEYRLYRRDEKGKVVKNFDHAMDTLRYLVVMFDRIAKQKPVAHTGTSQMAADTKAGY